MKKLGIFKIIKIIVLSFAISFFLMYSVFAISGDIMNFFHLHYLLQIPIMFIVAIVTGLLNFIGNWKKELPEILDSITK